MKPSLEEQEDRTESDISPLTVSTAVDERSVTDIGQANKNPKTNEKKQPKERGDTLLRERGDPLFADSGRASSEIPDWLQEFRENLVDDEIQCTETHTPVLLMKYL